MKRGQFITLEGCEGVGKTTAMNSALELLAREKIDAVSTREPGGTGLGEALRELLLSPATEAIDGDAELLLMFAARAQHINKVIKPALLAGKWVISDRFTDATYAYQGGGRGLSEDRIALIENWVQGELRPDLTLLLDAPIEVGLQRAGRRGALDRFEQENLPFFNSVREAYLRRAEREPNRFCVIAADRPIESVQASICAALQSLIESVSVS